MPLPDDELFATVAVAHERPARGLRELIASLLGHAVVAGLLLLVPLLTSDPPPAPRAGTLRVFLAYDPPPPPPPPLAQGPGLSPMSMPDNSRTTAPSRLPDAVAPSLPAVAPREDHPEPPGDPAGGDPDGSVSGEVGGLPGGIEGGVIGGVPGGVRDGVIGGTGTGPPPVPVKAPDRPARILRMTRPRYPRDAFVAKREGTVVLEILIDDQGRVVRTRVLQSVPVLDAAAVECVHAWEFAPALHGGRPVASLANAPISFRIY